MEKPIHPAREAFYEWIKSDTGWACLEMTGLGAPDHMSRFQKNRLEQAFMGAWDAREKLLQEQCPSSPSDTYWALPVRVP